MFLQQFYRFYADLYIYFYTDFIENFYSFICQLFHDTLYLFYRRLNDFIEVHTPVYNSNLATGLILYNEIDILLFELMLIC